MNPNYQQLIEQAYHAFNARDINAVLLLMSPDVKWPNGWEGGYVNGHNEVRDYWTRQWKEIDPTVKPVSFNSKTEGQLEVEVEQIAKDVNGNVLFEGIVYHTYTFEKGVIKSMEIATLQAIQPLL